MPGIHKLIEGGGQHLPFALAQELAMRQLGMPTAVRRFKVGSADVSIRIIGDDSFIHIRDADWLAVPLVADLTLSGAFNLPYLATPPPGPLPEAPEPPEEPSYMDCQPPSNPIPDRAKLFENHVGVQRINVGLQDGEMAGLTLLSDPGTPPPPLWGPADGVTGANYDDDKYHELLRYNTWRPYAWALTGSETYTYTVVDSHTDIHGLSSYNYNLVVTYNVMLAPAAAQLRAAVEAWWATDFSPYDACVAGNEDLRSTYARAVRDYPREIVEWQEEIDSLRGAMCTPHEATKRPARTASRIIQLATLREAARRGMAEPFMRASVQASMAYIPKRQGPENTYIRRISSTPGTTAGEGTVSYMAGERELTGTWSTAGAANGRDTRLTLQNIWADDLPNILDGIYPGMFKISGEYQFGQMVDGVLEFHEERGGITPAFTATPEAQATTLPEYRGHLKLSTEPGTREIDDDRHLRDGIYVDLELIEYEALDPFTAVWGWTSAPGLFLTDPIDTYDSLACTGHIEYIDSGHVDVRAVRWAGTARAQFKAAESGVGAWVPNTFVTPEDLPTAEVSWALTAEILAKLPSAVALLHGVSSDIHPLDPASDAAWPASKAKKLPAPAETPAAADAPKWAATQCLIWAGRIPIPQE